MWATVISVDDHVVEPAHTFEGRLPAALADRAPRIVETGAGHQVWEFEGGRYTQVGMNAVAGRRPDTVRVEPFRFDQMRPGCFDVDARVADMDVNGVWASLNFPSQISGFCGRVFFAADDPVLGAACVRAWNDWLHEEWAVSPPRPDHPARHRLPVRSGRGRRRDPAQRRPGLQGGGPARAPSCRRAAEPVGPGPLGPDPRGLRRDGDGGVPPRRQLRHAGRPTRGAGSAALRHPLRPAGADRLCRVAVVRPPAAPPGPGHRHERGWHRLGGHAARPARQRGRPVRLRPRLGPAPGGGADPQLLVLHARRSRRPSTPATASGSATSWWRPTTRTGTAPGRTPRPSCGRAGAICPTTRSGPSAVGTPPPCSATRCPTPVLP